MHLFANAQGCAIVFDDRRDIRDLIDMLLRQIDMIDAGEIRPPYVQAVMSAKEYPIEELFQFIHDSKDSGIIGRIGPDDGPRAA